MSRWILLLLLAAPLAAQPSVEARLAALETQMRELHAKNAELEQKLSALTAENDVLRGGSAAPAAAATPPPAATRQSPTLTFGGLLQAQAESGGRVDSRFTSDNDRVFLRRARVNVQGKAAEHFDYRVEVDAAGSLSNATGLRAQLTDAFIQWTRHRAAEVRIGQFKTPFGFEQLYSDPRLLAPERTLVSDRLTLGRQLGIQLGGELVPKRLRYAVGTFNGNGTNTNFNDDDGFLVAGRVSGTLWDRDDVRLNAGANAYRSEGAAAQGTSRRRGWGADAQLLLGRAEVWAELLRASGASRGDGWSVQTSYDLVPGKWQAVLRYDTLDATDGENTWLGGANYYLKGHDLKLQLHYMQSETDSRVIARVQTVF